MTARECELESQQPFLFFPGIQNNLLLGISITICEKYFSIAVVLTRGLSGFLYDQIRETLRGGGGDQGFRPLRSALLRNVSQLNGQPISENVLSRQYCISIF